MGRLRRFRITTASHEIFTIRRESGAPAKSFCPACQAEVFWLSVRDATAVCQISPRELVREIERERFHYREMADGQLRICRNSLLGEANS